MEATKTAFILLPQRKSTLEEKGLLIKEQSLFFKTRHLFGRIFADKKGKTEVSKAQRPKNMIHLNDVEICSH